MLGFCYAEILQVFHRTHPGVLLEQVGEIASVDSNVVRQLLHLHRHTVVVLNVGDGVVYVCLLYTSDTADEL